MERFEARSADCTTIDSVLSVGHILENLVFLLCYPFKLFRFGDILPEIDDRVGSSRHDILLIPTDCESPDLYGAQSS